MSPDQYTGNKALQQRNRSYEFLSKAYPNLFTSSSSDHLEFRGLTVFLGDTADYVGGWKWFADDGTPMVVWASGEDLPDCLYSLDRRVGQGGGRPDTKVK